MLGPLLTTLPLAEYFGSPAFFSYFLNILGWPHYLLPGVFEQNPSVGVNYSLWTVPYEIGCYVIFSGIIFFGMVRSSSKVAACTVLLLLTAVVVQYSGIIPALGARSFPGKLLDFLFIDRGAKLWPAFLIGILYYQLRYRIPYDRRIFFAWSQSASPRRRSATTRSFYKNTLFHLLMLPVLGYMTVFIGLTPIGMPGLFKRGDYSYGLYLYHMPFLQALICLFPGIWAADLWWTLFFAAAPVSLLAAMLSWHFVEKPTLRLRKKFSFTAARSEAEAAKPAPARDTAAPDLPVSAIRAGTGAT